LNVQLEFDPVISFARTARASREVQSDAQQREAARARAIRRRQHKLDDLVNIAQVVRIGAPTCDVNVHLNYITATGIDVWNGDPEHVIDVIPYFTKPDIEVTGIKLVSSKMPWLLKFSMLPCARVVFTGVLTKIGKLV
jgi:hypothetical protein